MINFFRKTRKKLADDNKFFKYSRYAIGEIVLVVIGILIALQINNWNQTNSEERISLEYTSNLLIELNSDLSYFEQLIDKNLQQKNYIDEILIALNSVIDGTSEKELMLKLSKAMNPSDFSPKTATYTDLITSGKMGLIKPVNFRQKIITHYNLMEQKISHINRELDYSWNHQIPLLNDKGYFEWRNYPLVSIDTLLISKTKHFSILNLKKSSRDYKELENALYFSKLMLTTRNQNLDELIQSTENLIHEIEIN